MASTTLLAESAKRQAEIDEAMAEYLARGGSVKAYPAYSPSLAKLRVAEAYGKRRKRRRYEKRILGPNPHG